MIKENRFTGANYNTYTVESVVPGDNGYITFRGNNGTLVKRGYNYALKMFRKHKWN